MITLSRRVNESVLINEDIRVTVVHLKNHRVRLQIDAPSFMTVRRERLELDGQRARRCHATAVIDFTHFDKFAHDCSLAPDGVSASFMPIRSARQIDSAT